MAVTDIKNYRSDPDPDLSVLNGGRRPAPVLPLDAFGPDLAPWIRDTAEGASAPVDYTAASLLPTLGALLANVRQGSPWPTWKEPPVVWMGLVGSPSSGKSPAMDAAMRTPVAKLETEIGQDFPDTLRRWRADKEAAAVRREDWQNEVKEAAKTGKPPPCMPESAEEPERPEMPRLLVIDSTPEALIKLAATQPRGLLVSRDELAGWLQGFDRYRSGGERAMWLEAFGGRKFRVDRKGDNGPLEVPHLSACVVGSIQPDRLEEALLSGLDDGLSSRFLLTWPDPVPPARPRQLANNAIIDRMLSRLWHLPRAIDQHGQEIPLPVPFDPPAADMFDDWRREHHQSDPGGRLAGFFGKQQGVVIRLAVILEFAWWAAKPEAADPPATISADAVGWAADLVNDYFAPMAVRCYGDAALPEEDRLTAILCKWIARDQPTTVNARSLRRDIRLPGIGSQAKPVQTAIDGAVEAGWLLPDPSREGSNPGRARKDYRVNPKLWEALADG